MTTTTVGVRLHRHHRSCAESRAVAACDLGAALAGELGGSVPPTASDGENSSSIKSADESSTIAPTS